MFIKKSGKSCLPTGDRGSNAIGAGTTTQVQSAF